MDHNHEVDITNTRGSDWISQRTTTALYCHRCGICDILSQSLSLTRVSQIVVTLMVVEAPPGGTQITLGESSQIEFTEILLL